MSNTAPIFVDFALVGAGFWAEYQLAAWRELDAARCVAIVDRDLAKAQRLAEQFGIGAAYDNLETLFANHELLFVDIVSSVDSHGELITDAARHCRHIICQKPLAPDLATATALAAECRRRGVRLFVHENWRWQRPLRALKTLLESRPIGDIFRARIDYNNSFPVFDNQPALKELSEFILADMGPHLFDVARFLFGEAKQIHCQAHRTRSDIRGEDVASATLLTEGNITVQCNMSYASRLEFDRFPETNVLIEGSAGSLHLDHDHWISLTTAAGTLRRRYAPPFYAWADPRYAVVQSSMVDCHAHLFHSIYAGTPAETSAEDNLLTLALVEAAYQSARQQQVIPLSS